MKLFFGRVEAFVFIGAYQRLLFAKYNPRTALLTMGLVRALFDKGLEDC